MSHHARIMFGYTLLTVPTIVYGGLTLLGVVTHGELGAPAPQTLTEAQRALYRAGHAHAGVLLILSLLLQLALDHARLPHGLILYYSVEGWGSTSELDHSYYTTVYISCGGAAQDCCQDSDDACDGDLRCSRNICRP